MSSYYCHLNQLFDQHNFFNALLAWACFRQQKPPVQCRRRGEFNELSGLSEKESRELVNRFIKVLKPRVGTLKESKQGKAVFIKSQFFEESQISLIRELYPFLQDCPASPNPDDQLESLSLVQPTFQISKIQLSLPPPFNLEFNFWNYNLKLQNLVKTTGFVVRGKQYGTQIGLPTANVSVVKQELMELPNGIYRVMVNGNLKGTASLGINPHVQKSNSERKLQIYMHDWDRKRQYYGEFLQVQFQKMIRFQGKFSSLGAFLLTVWNDVWTQ